MKKNVLATLCAAVLACAIIVPAALQGNVAPQAAVSGDVARTATATTANDQAVQSNAPEQDEAIVSEASGDGDGSNDTPYIPGEMIVKIADGTTVDQLNASLAELDYITTKQVSEDDVLFGHVKVELAEGVSVEDASTAVVSDAFGVVTDVQPNYIYHMASAVDEDAPYAASSLEAGTIDESALSTQALAGDPLASQQWGLEAVHAYQAWQLARVDRRVTVAVLDSGVNVNHPDLKDSIVGATSYINTIGMAPNIRPTNNVTDVFGHGTHVAGIIAATTSNGEGVAGVSYNARIMPVQVADSGGDVTPFDFAQGMGMIIAKKDDYNIRVVNISLGTTKEKATDSTIMDAIADAHEAGLLIVYAAGNGGTSSNTSSYNCLPCDYDTASGALGVISVQKNVQQGTTSYTRSYFSNFNKDGQRTKDISAPGSTILSTSIKEEGEKKSGVTYTIKNSDGSTNYNYGTNNGTSMAAPYVSGIAALLFAAYPSLTPEGVEDILKQTAIDLYTSSNLQNEGQFDLYSGYGLVNAQAALQKATQDHASSSPSDPAPFITGDNVVAKGSMLEGIGNEPITLSVANDTGEWNWETANTDKIEIVGPSTAASVKVNGKKAGTAVVTAKRGSTTLTRTVYVVDPTISGPTTIAVTKGATTQLTAPDPIVGTWEWSLALLNNNMPVTIDQTGKITVTDDVSAEEAIEKVHVSILLKTDSDDVNQGAIKGTYELSFAKREIADSDVSVSDQPYANPATKPSVVVTVDGATLTEGTDYDVAFDPAFVSGTTVYAPATNVTATITGKGAYSGVVTKTFRVLSDFEQNAVVTFTAGTNYTYKGSAWEPDIQVTMSGSDTPLAKNRDYFVEYSNNVNAGTGIVTIRGHYLQYPGTITREFTINPFSLTDSSVTVSFPEQTYTGSALTPEPTVTLKDGFNTRVLKRGTDFDYKTTDYSNNTDAGNGRLKITGKGNYKDTRTDQFTIKKASLKNMSLSGSVSSYKTVYNRKVQAPNVVVTGSNGKQLDSMRDYELVIPAGRRDPGDYTYYATARAGGNYTGEAHATMTILKASVSSVTLWPTTLTYTGAVQVPTTVTVKTSNGLTLRPGEYSTLYYDSSGQATMTPKQKGTYTVVITGKGSYFTGTARATYTIESANSGGSSSNGSSGNNSNNSGGNNSSNNSGGGSNNNSSNSGGNYSNNNSGGSSNNGGSNSNSNANSNTNNEVVHEGPKRLYGDVALDTMQRIVEEGWSGQSGGTVVLTTVDGYWDALTAAGVAGMAKAPVLMTDTYGLSWQTETIIRQLRPSTIVVCGGNAAVSDAAVWSAAEAAGGARIIRCWGQTATGTAVSAFNNAVSEGLGTWSPVAFVCTNDGYWDALAAAPISYAKAMPIFLTEGRYNISDETINAMVAGGVQAFYIVGGPAAVDDYVAVRLTEAGIGYAGRLSGDTAVETSEEVANFGLSWGMGCSKMGIATTNGYWDALAGAPLCGLNNSVLVLAGDAGSHSIAGFVRSHSAEIGTCYVFGGEAALDAATYQALQDATS